MIRPAQIEDVPAIGKIINDCAEYGLMLHRSPTYLYEHLRDFHVAEKASTVVGVSGLKIAWSNLVEVYALAVAPDHRGQGLGKQLTQACLDEADHMGIAKVMTLTYEEAFFRRLGFDIVDRQTLPLKVWSECAACPKNERCDEIAMIRMSPSPRLRSTAEHVVVDNTSDETPVQVSIRGK